MSAGLMPMASMESFGARHRFTSILLWALAPTVAIVGLLTSRATIEVVLATLAVVSAAAVAAVASTPLLAATATSLGLSVAAGAFVWFFPDAPLAWLPALVGLVMVTTYEMWLPILAYTGPIIALGVVTGGDPIALVLAISGVSVAVLVSRRLPGQPVAATARVDRFRAGFDEAPLGMAILKPSGEMVEVNKAMASALGYEPAQLASTNIASLVHVDDQGELGQAWEEMGNSTDHKASEWMRWMSASGRPLWARVSLSLVPRSETQPALVVLHLEHAADADDESRRLEARLRAKDQLVAALGEEIQKPLGLLIDLTGVAEHAHVDNTETLPRIEAHAMEIASIVDDLVLAARSGTMPISVVSSQVEAADLCRSLLSRLPGRGAVATSYEPGEIWADPELVTHVVTGLLGNAIRYGGPDVHLRTYASGPDTVIEVSDDGPEIPPGERERIFEADLRTGSQVTSPAAVGLSLTVGRQLARAMEGELDYFRRGGRNVFELRLPSERITADPGTHGPRVGALEGATG